MKVIPTKIPDALILEPKIFGDERGFFFESFNKKQFKELTGIDKEFVQEFIRCVDKVLGKTDVKKIGREKRQYRVIYHNYYLHEFLKRGFEELKPYIEAYPTDFIRGFSDSEGGPKVSVVYWKHLKWLSLDIGITNTNKGILEYLQRQLKDKFHISGIIKPNHRKGSEFVINNKTQTRTKDAYELVIGKIDDIRRYSRNIGFSIFDKQVKLNDAIKLFDKHKKPKDRVDAWISSYEKVNNKWVKKTLYQSKAN